MFDEHVQAHSRWLVAFVSMNPERPSKTFLTGGPEGETKDEFRRSSAFSWGRKRGGHHLHRERADADLPTPAHAALRDHVRRGLAVPPKPPAGFPSLTSVMKSLADVGERGRFVRAKGAGHYIFSTNLELVQKNGRRPSRRTRQAAEPTEAVRRDGLAPDDGWCPARTGDLLLQGVSSSRRSPPLPVAQLGRRAMDGATVAARPPAVRRFHRASTSTLALMRKRHSRRCGGGRRLVPTSSNAATDDSMEGRSRTRRRRRSRGAIPYRPNRDRPEASGRDHRRLDFRPGMGMRREITRTTQRHLRRAVRSLKLDRAADAPDLPCTCIRLLRRATR